MREPGKVRQGGTATIRIKTPQEIERQFNRANLSNWMGNGDTESAWRRDRAIIQAAKNARARAGYEATGVRTRYNDQIFRNISDGKYFTVQGDRIVAYRGNKIRR